MAVDSGVEGTVRRFGLQFRVAWDMVNTGPSRYMEASKNCMLQFWAP